MKKKKLESKDRVYLLKGNKHPLTLFLASRDTPRKRLLYFDEETGKNHPLRYARNSNTPFQDEQDSNVILEPIVFEDGILRVPKNNPVLQEFLHYHPDNGSVFYEFDSNKTAEESVEQLYNELDAQLKARDMEMSELEAVARIILGSKVDKMTTSEIKRDVMVYAKREPQDFMELVNDPSLQITNIAARAVSDGYLTVRNNNRDIYYNFKDNKKKLLTVPFGEEPIQALSSYLQSNDGLELYKFLEDKFAL